MKSFLLLVVGSILLTCAGGKQDFEDSAMLYSEAETAPDLEQKLVTDRDLDNKPDVATDITKKIIRSGSMGIEVVDLAATKLVVDTLLIQYSGYYANEQYANNDYENSLTLNIRLPQSSFDQFMAAFEQGPYKVRYKNIDARDVTEQFIDLETRLNNKETYLIRYRELVTKAKSVKEILEIEEKIRVLEEEIESTKGRLKYLNNQVDYSTLNLTITQKSAFKFQPQNRAKFTEKLKQSLSGGWYGFVDFLLFMFRLWPFWILTSFLVYFWKKFKRRKKH